MLQITENERKMKRNEFMIIILIKMITKVKNYILLKAHTIKYNDIYDWMIGD